MKKYFLLAVLVIIVLPSGCDSIICKYRNLPDLGNGYKFETLDCETLSIVRSDNTLMIGGVILSYAFDSAFIIVSQRPWDSIPNIQNMRYREANKAFEESTFLQYWIINKKEKNYRILDTIGGAVDYSIVKYSNVYGPFQKKEFLKKRKIFGIPDSLRLEKAKNYSDF